MAASAVIIKSAAKKLVSNTHAPGLRFMVQKKFLRHVLFFFETNFLW